MLSRSFARSAARRHGMARSDGLKNRRIDESREEVIMGFASRMLLVDGARHPLSWAYEPLRRLVRRPVRQRGRGPGSRPVGSARTDRTGRAPGRRSAPTAFKMFTST